MTERPNYFYYAFVITIVLFALVVWSDQPPAPKPASAPDNEFSGERAYNILSELLRENQPHPVGSALNKVVKERIIDELDKYDIANSVQATWQCSRSLFACTYVENIIAIIPGKQKTGYVTLMAHYDSVPTAPGAGDDGAAVAAMLEAGRILKAEAPFDKPVMLLFTDAEEIGLIGAEAFFNKHELAKDVSIVLNYEGSGTTGISQVLRTSGNNRIFMNAFQQENIYARGASLINEIFKRMPNDTDFSVVMRSGIPGIDMAFAYERNHYHTPNDNLNNIDVRTMQHHGENMLPVVRWLASNDFESKDPNLVYNQFYSGWLQWPTNVTPVLIVLSLIFVMINYVRSKATFGGVATGFGSSLLVFILTGVTSYAAFEIISFFQGTIVSWPAYDLPYRTTLFASGLLGGLVAGIICQRFLTTDSGIIGALILWLILATVIYFYMPDAANIIVIPLLSLAIIHTVAGFYSGHTSRFILFVSLIAIVPTTLGLVLPLEQTQGYRLIFATMPFLALFMTLFIPLVLDSDFKLPITASAIVTVLAIVATVMSPLYSELRPQHVNIIYVENVGEEKGYYWLSHRNPLPDSLSSIYELSPEGKQILPYTESEFRNLAEVDSANLSAPELEVISITNTDSGRVVELQLKSSRAADAMQLALPGSAKLAGFTLGDLEVKENPIMGWSEDRFNSIRIVGTYSKTISLTLNLESSEPVEAFLIDRSTRLPESAAPLLAERTGLVSPQHQGDLAILIQPVTF